MEQIFQSRGVIVKPWFCVFLALAFLIVPFRWMVGWFTAVFFHEFCHYIALRICRIPVIQITIGTYGADILTGEMTTFQEIICALAGPLGGLLLLLFLQEFPYVSLCALGQSLFNLLPIYPMDGGRVVKGMCVMLLGEEFGIQCSKVSSMLFSFLLIGACMLISLHYKLGVLPILISLLVFIRTIKIPCKERELIVQ